MKKTINVLLINPEDITGRKRLSALTPFAGFAFIRAFCEKSFGKEVSIEIIEMLPERIQINDVLKRIADDRIDICGITSKTYNYTFALKLADAIKEYHPTTLIIFGGAHPNALPKEVIKNMSIDAIVTREGEITFNNIIRNI